MKYPVQFVYHNDLSEGYVVFLTAWEYHEDLMFECSRGLDEVFDITPIQSIPEDY